MREQVQIFMPLHNAFANACACGRRLSPQQRPTGTPTGCPLRPGVMSRILPPCQRPSVTRSRSRPGGSDLRGRTWQRPCQKPRRCLLSLAMLPGCGSDSAPRPGHGRDTDRASKRISAEVARRRPPGQRRQQLRVVASDSSSVPGAQPSRLAGSRPVGHIPRRLRVSFATAAESPTGSPTGTPTGWGAGARGEQH